MNTGFPFVALVGQEEMRLALQLVAVDPSIGGVLIRGERGTAKSTAARGLADLLPPGADDAPAPFVELPPGTTEDRVVGSLDIEPALHDGRRRLRPGLLARADGGVLYIDEVNLLPDHLVDLLLDAAASGIVRVERDGLSETQAARFALLGSMNPEEGDLRPQFLDRFGLCVEVRAPRDPATRVASIRRRLAHEADPLRFRADWQQEESATRAQLAGARARLDDTACPDELLTTAAELGADLGLEGLRGDLALVKAARALAALEARPAASLEDLRRVAGMALSHRLKRQPLEPWQDPGPQLDAFFEERTGSSTRNTPPPPDDAPPPTLDAVQLLGALPRTAASGRRRVDGPRGASRRVLPLSPGDTVAPGGSISVAATLTAAAVRGGQRPQAQDLRQVERAGRGGARVLFLVDTSGSMAAERRIAWARAAVSALLAASYQRRDEVAVLTFRGDTAAWLLPATRDVARAEAALAHVPTGGRTPLLAALRAAADSIRGSTRPTLLVLLTDGRANVGDGDTGAGGDPWQASLALARTLAPTLGGAVVVDCETGPVRLGRAQTLAEALQAEHVDLDQLTAGDLVLHLDRARRAP